MTEEELIKEITKTRSQVKDLLISRSLMDYDWDTLTKWWEKWPNWPTPEKGFLPNDGKGGIMIEKNSKPIVAGFLYQTNSNAVLLEWIVSDPEYRESDRQEAVELLIKEAEKICKEWGYLHMFTIGRNKNLIETHKQLGWLVDDKPSHEITKKLK